MVDGGRGGYSPGTAGRAFVIVLLSDFETVDARSLSSKLLPAQYLISGRHPLPNLRQQRRYNRRHRRRQTLSKFKTRASYGELIGDWARTVEILSQPQYVAR